MSVLILFPNENDAIIERLQHQLKNKVVVLGCHPGLILIQD